MFFPQSCFGFTSYRLIIIRLGLVKVATVHCAYQHRGGEDSVVEDEERLLETMGDEVFRFRRSNSLIHAVSRFDLAFRTLWSHEAAISFDRFLTRVKPDVVHVHNTFPLISPSVYWISSRAKVPVVQTLHNFRLMCPQAMFLREGRVCEDCNGKLPWRGALRGCYRQSVVQSSVLASMVSVHRFAGTWRNKVTRYIALNEFCRRKFVEGGLPADRIVIKPNFVDFPAPAQAQRDGFLFVGRLSPEKGVSVLMDACRRVNAIRVKVAGTGPDADLLVGVAGVTALGSLSSEHVREQMTAAVALVLPSIWYENFPRTLVEAMGCGLPVIASRLGALAELVEDGVTGLLFQPGDAADLAEKLTWARSNPEAMLEMGRQARMRYDSRYTASENYTQLISIYSDAIAEVRREADR